MFSIWDFGIFYSQLADSQFGVVGLLSLLACTFIFLRCGWTTCAWARDLWQHTAAFPDGKRQNGLVTRVQQSAYPLAKALAALIMTGFTALLFLNNQKFLFLGDGDVGFDQIAAIVATYALGTLLIFLGAEFVVSSLEAERKLFERKK